MRNFNTGQEFQNIKRIICISDMIITLRFLFKSLSWGTWVTQSVKQPTLDFSSSNDLTVCEFEPHIELCADITEPAWDSVSLSLSALPHLLALSQNK